MKKLTKVMFGLLAIIVLLASCMKSDDNTTTLYGDTAITSFTLGTLNRYVHTTSSTGADSIYKVTITGSNYKCSIDEENHLIFNADSLPVGTDIQHVICTVTTLNNGSVYIEDLESDDLLFTSDSVDFSSPRVFRVYASDGSGYQRYTVKLNVHQEEGEKFVWSQHAKSSELEGLQSLKAVMLEGNLYVYGTKDGKTVGYKTEDGTSWTTLAEIEDPDACQNILECCNALYTICQGALIKSSDGETWTVVNDAVDVVKLVAASYTELYGLTSDGTMLVSDLMLDNEGKTWEEDALDTDKEWLPQNHIAYVCYPAKMTYYADYLLIAGVSTGVDGISAVWRKIVEYDLQGLEDKWVYMDRSDDNYFALPQLENLVMMPYDDGILVWGITDGTFSPIYQSRDNGLIWKTNSHYKLPDDFKNGAVSSFAATTDGKEIWLVSATGAVWQGHLNRVAWDKSE